MIRVKYANWILKTFNMTWGGLVILGSPCTNIFLLLSLLRNTFVLKSTHFSWVALTFYKFCTKLQSSIDRSQNCMYLDGKNCLLIYRSYLCRQKELYIFIWEKYFWFVNNNHKLWKKVTKYNKSIALHLQHFNQLEKIIDDFAEVALKVLVSTFVFLAGSKF